MVFAGTFYPLTVTGTIVEAPAEFLNVRAQFPETRGVTEKMTVPKGPGDGPVIETRRVEPAPQLSDSCTVLPGGVLVSESACAEFGPIDMNFKESGVGPKDSGGPFGGFTYAPPVEHPASRANKATLDTKLVSKFRSPLKAGTNQECRSPLRSPIPDAPDSRCSRQ